MALYGFSSGEGLEPEGRCDKEVDLLADWEVEALPEGTDGLF